MTRSAFANAQNDFEEDLPGRTLNYVSAKEAGSSLGIWYNLEYGSGGTKDANAELLHNLTGAFIFECSNGYGCSAKGMGEGQQLNNKRADNDQFRVHILHENIFMIESLSSPGLFIGIGQKGPSPLYMRGLKNDVGFKAVLVPASDPSCHMRLASARNGSDKFVSIESVTHPGHLLNHCTGPMWFFNRPANKEKYFAGDASWFLRQCAPPADPIQGAEPHYVPTYTSTRKVKPRASKTRASKPRACKTDQNEDKPGRTVIHISIEIPSDFLDNLSQNTTMLVTRNIDPDVLD